jgi:hypothetical protein
MAEERKRRTSRVLEYLQKQQEERETAQAESGGDQPFPDLRSELGLGKSTTEGEQ